MSIEVSGSPAALQTAIDHRPWWAACAGLMNGASSAPSLLVWPSTAATSFRCSQVPLVHVNGLRTRSGWHTLP